MKRWYLALLCALLLVLTGCGAETGRAAEEHQVYSLYFCQADLNSAAGGDAVGTEPSDIVRDENAAPQPLAKRLMEALLAGPADERHSSPFPEGTALRTVRVSGGRAVVDLTSHYGTLSGVELTLADYCITLTLTQIPEVRSVIITVNNRTLSYRATQIFTARDALLSSADDVVAEVEAKLYFCNDVGVLVPERRTLQLYEGDTRAETLVEELIRGPANRRLTPSLSENFSVQDVWVKDGKCYVNLSSEMLESFPEEEPLFLSVSALGLSLMSLQSVREVQILVDGIRSDTLNGVKLPPLVESGE